MQITLGHSRKDPHFPPPGKLLLSGGGRGEQFVSVSSKCIRMSEGGRGVNFQFPLWGPEVYMDVL
jgi:hypothetical protein